MRITLAEPQESDRLDMPWQGSASHYLDLRGNARSIYQIAAARSHPPLGRFLATVNSDDSMFTTLRSQVRSGPAESLAPAAEAHEFTSRIALVFAREASNFERGHFQGLATQLAQLLERDSPADSLEVRLTVAPCRYLRLGRDGFHLLAALRATGATPEQAELRWGFGLARLQQALLFLSRVIRQHLPDTPRS